MSRDTKLSFLNFLEKKDLLAFIGAVHVLKTCPHLGYTRSTS